MYENAVGREDLAVKKGRRKGVSFRRTMTLFQYMTIYTLKSLIFIILICIYITLIKNRV